MAGDEHGGVLRLAAGESVERVVGDLDADPAAWLALDDGVRRALEPSSWDTGYERWHRLRSLPLPSGPYTGPLLATALCHGDGRVREKALKEAEAHPGLLPLVVVRCADWAGPVRLRARALLWRMLTVGRAVALTPLVLRVGRRSRGDCAVGLVRDVLRQATAGELGPLLAHRERRVRRFAVRLVVEEGLFTPVELARTAAADADVVVQNLCSEAALAALAPLPDGHPQRAAVLEPLLGARNAHARAGGVTALRRSGRPDRAGAYLCDRSAVVRACARWVLREHGVDPLPRYRTLCANPDDPAVPPGAVAGLAECGAREDARLLRPLLAHPAAAVRARAVAGLRQLDAVDRAELLPLLEDPAAGVAREAATALLPDAARLDPAPLARLLGPGRPAHQRRAALRLLIAHGGLPRLRASVALLDDPDEGLRRRALRSLGDWPPVRTAQDGAEVAALLERARDHVPRSRLEFLISATGTALAPRRDA
ncbi:hypothetical protein [Streptomyces fragilis]|uniref:HEAT repeat domain-containing protein n=1 Tax=Streptomyces fragilis TaxID=67301 RepID=A0ABV2YAK4_9ACTN|nr:hypothetical protein [Streptomyces fragilis]